jgi:hypothetical protein
MSENPHERKGGNYNHRAARKDYNVTLLARIAQSKIIGDFEALPVWAKRELLVTLNAKFPGAAEIQSAPGSLGNDASKGADGIPSSPMSAKKPKAPKEKLGRESDHPTHAESRKSKLQGYERPIVCDLAVSKRLSVMTASERKAASNDLSVLSSALAAIGRGFKEGATEEEIRGMFVGKRESVKNFSRLWPSLSTLKDYALGRLQRVDNASTPKIMSAGSVAAIRTNVEVRPMDESVPEGSIPPTILSRIAIHDPRRASAEFGASLVSDFVNGRRNNYKELEKYIHSVNDQAYVYWVPYGVSGIRWGSDDEEISITPSTPEPRSRKRRKKDNDNNERMVES